MPTSFNDIEAAIEVFVRGFCFGKSRTYPYECVRVGKLRVLRDAPRPRPRDYRKEEWVAYGVAPAEVDRVARRHTRGRFFVSAIHGVGEPDGPLRAEYKRLGYRLLSTEPFFVHSLNRIPRAASPATVRRVRTTRLADQLGKATRTRPIAPEHLGPDAPLRQYAALVGDQLVGWVRSIVAGDSTWCADMAVRPAFRRQGIGTALLAKMLRDDRARDSRRSVLLASHAGAHLYPRVGYQQIGMLLIYAPVHCDASRSAEGSRRQPADRTSRQTSA